MATKTQRAINILSALADPIVVDAALLTKVGDAYAYTYRHGETLTPAQKAGLFIQITRARIVQDVTNAIKAAAAAGADSDIDLGSDGV